jgi:hypothetical protein
VKIALGLWQLIRLYVKKRKKYVYMRGERESEKRTMKNSNEQQHIFPIKYFFVGWK